MAANRNYAAQFAAPLVQQGECGDMRMSSQVIDMLVILEIRAYSTGSKPNFRRKKC
jgi:hypothetical protein